MKSNNDHKGDKKRIFAGFLSLLGRSNIPYVLSRDYDCLSEIDDLDIFIRKKDRFHVLEILKSMIEQEKNLYASRLMNSTTEHIMIHYVFSDLRAFKFDLIWEVRWKGIRFLDFRYVEVGRRKGGYVFVPPFVEELYFLVIKEILKHKGLRLRAKYTPIMQRLLNRNRQEVRTRFITAFGKCGAQAIEHLIDNSHILTYSMIRRIRRRIVRCVLMYCLSRNLIKVISDTFNARYWIKLLQSKTKRNGVFVAVYGPDGSGKTTVVKRLCASLNRLRLFAGTDVFHFRPAALPAIRLAYMNMGWKVKGSRPYVLPPRSAFMSILKLVYCILDYNIGYLFCIKPLLVMDRVIVFDRYFLDLCLDSRRCRMGLNTSITRYLYRVIPKPDINIFLVGKPRIVAERKGELTVTESVELMKRYHREGAENGIVIDSSRCDSDTIVERVLSSVINIAYSNRLVTP